MPSTPTDAYTVINETITREVLDLFQRKQGNHTTGEHFLLLGAKGQFAELNKKFWKLYAAVWTGEVELIGEDVEEVASDMIGHLLLLIYSLRRDRFREDETDAQAGGSRPTSAQRSGPSAHEGGGPRGGIPETPRCGRCEDCLASDPVWCGMWTVPNEYALTNMNHDQFERMRRMFQDVLP